MNARDLQLLQPKLRNSIEIIIEQENFTQYDVTVRKLSNRDNFLGILYEIIIKDSTSGCEREVNLFVKKKFIPRVPIILNMEQVYRNEEFFYKDISKIMRSLQDQANVLPEDRFKIAKAYDKTDNEAIILENLCKKGYKVFNITESVSLKFMQLGVQEIAKFHALSFIIEKKFPGYFKEKITVLENLYNFDKFKIQIRNVCKHVANLYTDDTKMKVENFIPIFLDKLPKYMRDRTNICTLTHGDYKKNNLMVRMNDDEVMDAIIIDYQLIDYGCPIRDLLYFLFFGSEQELRRKHLKNLKELYFETLSRFLKYFNVDVETVYPRKEFERVYTEWLDFGLMMSLSASVRTCLSVEELDLEKLSFEDVPFSPDKKADEKFRGLVDDFVQWGYL